MNKAFDWEIGEGRSQHDATDCMREMTNFISMSLEGSPYDGVIGPMFNIKTVNIIKCSSCDYNSQNEEINIDQLVPVNGMNTLAESLDSIFKFEEHIPDFSCSKCNQKTTVIKSQKLKKLPKVFTIVLNRLEYDPFENTRKKINTNLEFPLEANFYDYILKENNNELLHESEYGYKLLGFIVHSGSPFSVHYFSYIRDINKEGVHEIKKKTEKPKKEEKETEEKSKETMEEKVNNIEEIEQDENEEKEEEKQEEKEGEKEGRKNKKGKGKGKGKKNNKGGAQKQGKKGKGKQQQKNDEESDDDFCDKDFPIPYEDKDLANNWFLFDDSSIRAVSVGNLSKFFKSKTSAYVLLYVKNHEKPENYDLQEYLLNCSFLKRCQGRKRETCSRKISL